MKGQQTTLGQSVRGSGTQFSEELRPNQNQNHFMTLIMVDKTQPSYNVLNVIKYR